MSADGINNTGNTNNRSSYANGSSYTNDDSYGNSDSSKNESGYGNSSSYTNSGVEYTENSSDDINSSNTENNGTSNSNIKKKVPKFNIQKLITFFIIVILIPLTIIFGIYKLNDRKYFFISIMIVIYTMIPFFMKFEKRKPQPRELILIATMAAIAVIGRMAFFMLPQFKPVVAIVIITGVCFGPEEGFLTGAMAGLVSNFFFGQGPWTPWQMFSFGIIGFIAGIVFKKGRLKSNRIILCIFGGLSTFLIYGGIMNICAITMIMPRFTLKALLSTYATGIPFDLVHAFATVVFLFFISQPMIEKLERIKVKYDLF